MPENLAARGAVRSCWLSHSRGGQAIFLFEGSDSIHDAEKLVGLEVQIPLAERVKLPAGSYYITDLAGCEVRNASTGSTCGEPGAMIGHVRDVQMTWRHAGSGGRYAAGRIADSAGAGYLCARGHRGAGDRRGSPRRSSRFEHVGR